jgi:hypothetical protein
MVNVLRSEPQFAKKTMPTQMNAARELRSSVVYAFAENPPRPLAESRRPDADLMAKTSA